MRYSFIENIKENDILAKTVFADDCTPLLAANTRLTKRNIYRLGNLGFKGLYIYDDTDNADQADLLSDDVRQQALKSLKHINIDDCLFVANTITNNVLERPEMLYEMMNMCSYDDYTYNHCINVAILSTMIGVDMRLSNKELGELSQAALLHDIGKICIPDGVLNKKGPLTNEEFETVKQHPETGYSLLSDNNFVSEKVRLGILYHHENDNGTGYPMGIKSRDIPLFSKIIHVADVYDAMISKRSYKNPINPADVLEYIMGNAADFDIRAVYALVNIVTLYPAGAVVRLSDGQQATVMKNNKGYPQRPVVRTDNGRTIDMMSVLNITITETIA